MKKTICLTALLSILLLAGCFGTPENSMKGQSSTAPVSEGTSAASTSPSKAAEQPNFEDGQLYLQAIAKHDLAMCTKISDATLRTRCQAEVKAYSSKK